MRQILVRSSDTLPETQRFTKIPLHIDEDYADTVIDGPVQIKVQLDITCLNDQEFSTIGFHPTIPYALAVQGVMLCGATYSKKYGELSATLVNTGNKVELKEGDQFLTLNLYDKVSMSHIGEEYDVYGGVIKLDSKEQ